MVETAHKEIQVIQESQDVLGGMALWEPQESVTPLPVRELLQQ